MQPVPADGARARSRAIVAVSVVAILGWAVPAILMLDKGFAIEDEGSYVLSYRWWSSNPYFISGSQYLYGPIFEALGESVVLLRLLRLVMVLAFNAWFAFSFVTWLEARRSVLPSSRSSLVLLLTAGGGMSYAWAPLTPGYYDLTADASLALVALMLAALRRSPRLPAGSALASGVLAVVLVVTKWPAAPVILLTVGVVAWSLAGTAKLSALWYVVLVALGAAPALATLQLFLVPLGDLTSTMHTVSSLTATASHGLGYLTRFYLTSTAGLTLSAAVFAVPLFGGYLLARRAATLGEERRAALWLVGAAALTTGVLPFLAGWHGGNERGKVVIGIALAGLLTALAVGLTQSASEPSAEQRTGPVVAVVLLLVPVIQAAGTNVPLVYVGLECGTMWMALVLLVVAHRDPSHLVVTTVLADLGVFVVASSLIGGSTTLVTPFKTDGFQADRVQVSQLGLRVAPEVASRYAALQTALGPFVVRGRTPVFAMNANAGLTYLLGGVPVGSTWTDGESPSRTAGILELACRNGDVSSRSRPVLLFDRPPDAGVRGAMNTCGFGFPAGYRRLPVPAGPPGTLVFVPRRP